MSLFRLDASINPTNSTSRAVADIVEASWREGQPDAAVTRRSIGLEPLDSHLWARAVRATRGPEDQRTDEDYAALAVATQLVDELVDADALLFAIPLYNFGISQHFKAWVDLVMTDPRMAATGPRPLAGRPAVVVVVRGGAYGPGTPREGWDHASGWIRRILEDVWGLDLRVVETEFSLVGKNPALDQFKEIAAEMRRESDRLAAEHGRHLSGGSPS